MSRKRTTKKRRKSKPHLSQTVIKEDITKFPDNTEDKTEKAAKNYGEPCLLHKISNGSERSSNGCCDCGNRQVTNQLLNEYNSHQDDEDEAQKEYLKTVEQLEKFSPKKILAITGAVILFIFTKLFPSMANAPFLIRFFIVALPALAVLFYGILEVIDSRRKLKESVAKATSCRNRLQSYYLTNAQIKQYCNGERKHIKAMSTLNDRALLMRTTVAPVLTALALSAAFCVVLECQQASMLEFFTRIAVKIVQLLG